jgi:hypothetical protein
MMSFNPDKEPLYVLRGYSFYPKAGPYWRALNTTSSLVTRTRFELAISWMKTRRVRPTTPTGFVKLLQLLNI